MSASPTAQAVIECEDIVLAPPASPLSSPAAAQPGTVRGLLALASTMTLAQLAPLLVSLYLAGLLARQGSLSFSAYSLVNALNMVVFVAASSLLQGLYFVGGRAIGRDEAADYRAAIRAGVVIALLTAAVATALSVLAGPVFSGFGADERVLGQVGTIGIAAAFGILPAQLLVVFRVHAALNERAGLVTWIHVLGALATAGAATWAVQRADGDAEAAVLGTVAVAAAVQWLMLFASLLAVLLMRQLRFQAPRPTRAEDRFGAMLAVVWSVGWPIGAVVFFDNLASFISSLLVGRYWLEAVPVHSVVWLWVIVSLVLPLGVAQAATQRVAITHARGEHASRNRVVKASLMIAGTFGAVVAVLFSVVPDQIGGLLVGGATASEQANELMRRLLPLGGLALALQAVIIVAAANLRGIGLVKAPLFQAFVGYCVIATGAQYLLAVTCGFGPEGVWWGLIVGFSATALAVLWRCRVEFRLPAMPMPSVP